MTGPEHYREAQAHLVVAEQIETDGHDDSMSAWHQRQAQAHATLAMAASLLATCEDAPGWAEVIR